MWAVCEDIQDKWDLCEHTAGDEEIVDTYIHTFISQSEVTHLFETYYSITQEWSPHFSEQECLQRHYTHTSHSLAGFLRLVFPGLSAVNLTQEMCIVAYTCSLVSWDQTLLFQSSWPETQVHRHRSYQMLSLFS